MDLMLWRHAQARDARAGEDDLDRPLTAGGEAQATRMAGWLAHHLPPETRVLVSPARRCQQTAQALGRPWTTVPSLAPSGLPGQLLSVAGWPDAEAPVLLVGHQPTLGQVAALALCGEPRSWRVRKAAVWWLRSPPPGGAAGVLLVAVQGPQTV
jgi:phosphohistidine phosphatase